MNNIQIRRQELQAISMPLQKLVKHGAIDSVNEGLINFYAQQGHNDLNTFNQWTSKGYAVKKGEKALCLWGKPKQNKKEKNQENQSEDFTYFPICYVFSSKQVEKMESKSNTNNEHNYIN